MRDKYDTSVVDNKYNPHVLRRFMMHKKCYERLYQHEQYKIIILYNKIMQIYE